MFNKENNKNDKKLDVLNCLYDMNFYMLSAHY